MEQSEETLLNNEEEKEKEDGKGGWTIISARIAASKLHSNGEPLASYIRE